MVTMGFEFIADRPALDFVATVAERGTTHEEKLQTPADLLDWARQSGVVDDLTAAAPDELEHAQAVRDAIFRLIAAMINDTQPERADTTTVNRAASHPRPVLRLDNDGRIRRTGGLDALLAGWPPTASTCSPVPTGPPCTGAPIVPAPAPSSTAPADNGAAGAA